MIPVLCFGNPYLSEDNMAVQIAQELTVAGFEFKILQNPDEVLNYKENPRIFILDVFKNIDEVIIVDNIDKLSENKIYTMHDFDLGFFLKLMKRSGQIKEIIIIGLPQSGDKESIKTKVKDLMESFI